MTTKHLSNKQAGKRGGEKTLLMKGTSFYRKIGRKGGKVTRDSHKAEFYSTIGRKGGLKRHNKLNN